ncbi:hypothetical protein [Priestia megaterium]|uniref:hypothetical protein n=1 Tax=Priestia megaterium TaxID=1404 RepID=UPI00046E6E8E|nr:hypothetical protein [Priestia megaterium]PFB05259.1 hypothetical protein CN383_02875 [Priestia megaterium]
MRFLKDKFFNSDFGILLSLGSFLGYGFYYIYELSFNYYYRLPMDYVNFNLQGLAFTIFSIITAMSLLALLINFVLVVIEAIPFLKNKKLEIKSILHKLSIVSVILFSLLKMGGVIDVGNGLGYWLDLISYGVLIWAIIVGIKIVPSFLTIMAIILYALIISVLIGKHDAVNKEDYLILERDNQQSYVVINNYNEYFIIAPVNLKKKIITPKFQFIEMKSEVDKKLELKLTHTGKLKMKSYVK